MHNYNPSPSNIFPTCLAYKGNFLSVLITILMYKIL